MPIFDFQCLACGHEFSELIKGTEEILCEKCNSPKIKKLFSPLATISEEARLDANDPDLPSLADLRRFKKTGRLRS